MAAKNHIPVALTIAGSDPSSGAGVQADLKTFAALNVYGWSVVAAITAQNSSRVLTVSPIPPALLQAQISALIAERQPDAIKIGAVVTAANIRALAEIIRERRLPAPVIDPVMIASSGGRLLDRRAEQVLRDRLLPTARIVTPNLPEAEVLSGIKIDGKDAAREAARVIHRSGTQAVVIKGGHLYAKPSARDRAYAIDLFFDGRQFVELRAPRLSGEGAHGTGCAFSAAIAAYLARRASLEEAVRGAKRFVTQALRHRFKLAASGQALLGHFANRLK